MYNGKDKTMKLASLKLIATKKPSIVTEEQHRRSKLVRRLNEQIALAKSQQSGILFTPQKQRSIKDAITGVRQVVTTNKRVKPWWFTTDNNHIALTVRYGSQILELARGKFSVDVVNTEELIPTLELVIDAVNAGELDAQISSAAVSLRKGFKK